MTESTLVPSGTSRSATAKHVTSIRVVFLISGMTRKVMIMIKAPPIDRLQLTMDTASNGVGDTSVVVVLVSSQNILYNYV